MTANNSGDRITVVIVSDVRLYRDGLAACLSRQDHIDVQVSVATLAAMIADAVRIHPQIVLVDVSMPGSAAAVRKVHEVSPATKVVAFAVAEDESDVVALAEAGVSGYVRRDGSLNDLCQTIERVAHGELICSPHVAAQAFQRLASLSALAGGARSDESTLTAREREVAALIDAGFSNKQIARKLFITLPTVKNHVHHILAKLQVRGRGEASAKLRTGQSTPYPGQSASLMARPPG